MFRKRFVAIARWVMHHQTILTAVTGSIIVAIWTVLRHITNGINFDVVGQIGVAQQWVHGLQGGAVFGSTNYLLKMPLYILVNLADWIPPVIRLLILALVCSVGAYLFIYFVLRKIARLYGVTDFALLNLGMLWLATIAGRVFWVDYANSRNLEVAGGLAVLYLVLLLLERGVTWRRLLGLIIASSLIFFADPLQLYVIGGGVGIVTALVAVRQKGAKRRVALLAGAAIVAGAVGSRLFAWLSTVLLPVSYLTPPRTSFALGVDTVTTLFQNVLTSTLRIFDINVFTKAFSVNSLRQLGGMLLLGIAVYILVRYRKSAPKAPVRLLCWLIVWNYVVYIVSGNAQVEMTERYLVMVPVLLITLLGLYGGLPQPKVLQKLTPIWLVTVSLSGALLFGAVILQWPSRYTLDKPMFAMADFAQAHHYDFVVTSRVLAVPGNYYAGYDAAIIPTICVDDVRIKADNLFYDQAAYKEKLGRTNGSVAVILPDEGIVSGAFHCSSEAVIRQLGTPNKVVALPTIGTLYEYDGNTAALRSL